jgi:hypothetical protein
LAEGGLSKSEVADQQKERRLTGRFFDCRTKSMMINLAAYSIMVITQTLPDNLAWGNSKSLKGRR